MLRAVVSPAAFAFIADLLAIIGNVNIRAALLIAPSPASQADHFVVLFPGRERIVGGMNDGQPATAGDESDELLLRFRRPIRPVVIRNDQVVFTELRLEA